jgi:hypothetical protein
MFKKILFSALLVSLTACSATTSQNVSADYAGRSIKKNVSGYDKVLIKPVSFWSQTPMYENSSLKQVMVNEMFVSLNKKLEKCANVSKTMDEKTVVVEVSAFDDEKDVVALNNISIIEPINYKYSAEQQMFNPANVTIEVKVLDSINGKVLDTYVDQPLNTNNNKLVAVEMGKKEINKQVQKISDAICSVIK